MCNLLLVCLITSGGRNLPSSWGTTQHTWPAHEKKHPLPEEGRGGSERPLSLQRQLRGWLEFGRVCKVTIRRGAEAANREEGSGEAGRPDPVANEAAPCLPNPRVLCRGNGSPLRHHSHLESAPAGDGAGRPVQGPVRTLS